MTPREQIEAECARRGKDAVVDDCLALLAGSHDLERVMAVTNQGAEKYTDGRPHEDTYWFRVWAMRSLLWVWDPRATAALRSGFSDPHWRVREMAAKVTARHHVGDALPEAAAAQLDPVARVSVAARRAVAELTATSS